MAKNIQAIRGMHDILPDETPLWHFIESQVRKVLDSYGYQEIRMPLIESTDLFKRSIGEVTDIVEKEMYTFEDRNGDSLTLRPEGTASCVRAGLEHGLLHNSVKRLWYQGPMFRHERPQKGRYRQFHQIGVEAFGMAGAEIDAETILITARIWKALGLDNLELQLNSLGTSDERVFYRAQLVKYFESHQALLDEDSRRRLHSNPLRILDSKNPDMQELIVEAPRLMEHLGDESAAHFGMVRKILDEAGVKYVINTRLVRGLDYYSRTVFEWTSEELGAQGTVCAGGRYDGLVEQLGGHATPATGFAMGLERMILLLETQLKDSLIGTADVYMVLVGDAASSHGVVLAEQLRDSLPNLRLQVNCAGGSFKAQFKKADKSGARIALIIGETELADSVCAVKWLREKKQQETLNLDSLATFLDAALQET